MCVTKKQETGNRENSISYSIIKTYFFETGTIAKVNNVKLQ